MAVIYQVFPLGRTAMYRLFMGMDTCGARNWACREAAEEKAEYLLFWDDDMLPLSPSAFAALSTAMAQNPEIDVLGAVYPMRRRDAPEPIVIKENGEGVWWGWDDGGIHKVYMTGTGFTMIRMTSLAKLPGPEYFTTAGHSNGVDVGRRSDDQMFAELCRENGLSWYVHGGVVCDQIDVEGYKYRVEDARIKVTA
jgi:hypothetical protein